MVPIATHLFFFEAIKRRILFGLVDILFQGCFRQQQRQQQQQQQQQHQTIHFIINLKIYKSS